MNPRHIPRLFALLIPALLTLALCAFATPTLAQNDAPTRLFIDDLGRRVMIPADPQRIVSTDDVFVTVPLLELGAALVGSQGRPTRSGPPVLRSSKVLTGLGFDNSDLAYLGADPVDVEAIVAARPDLIVTLTTRSIPPDQLQQISPTVVLNPNLHRPRELYRLFAEVTGREAARDRMEAQYQAGLALIAVLLDGKSPTVSLFDATESRKISVSHTYGALGEAIRDAQLSLPALTRQIPEMEGLELSPEVLPEMDADLIIGTYRDDRQDGPAAARAALAALYPGYCEVLTACARGRIYFMPRDIARGNTYSARMMAIAFLLAILPNVVEPAPAN